MEVLTEEGLRYHPYHHQKHLVEVEAVEADVEEVEVEEVEVEEVEVDVRRHLLRLDPLLLSVSHHLLELMSSLSS